MSDSPQLQGDPENSVGEPSTEQPSPAVILDNIAQNLVPEFLEIKTWPENIKKEFLAQLYKSMVCSLCVIASFVFAFLIGKLCRKCKQN